MLKKYPLLQPKANIVEYYQKGLAMIVYLEPFYGDPKVSIELARAEVKNALGFRGSIADIKAEGNHIIIKVEVNPQWDLPPGKKVMDLKDCLPTRVRYFRVIIGGEHDSLP